MDLIEQLSDILKLLIASDELLLEELFEYLRDYLTEQRHNWILRDLILVFNTVHKHANCEFLQYCFETICFIHPVSLIASDKFPSLDRDMCYYFFENEVLTQIKEIVVWDHLIIWGTEQTPGLGRLNCDRNKWNNEDYEALKETLDEFIPLIRFTNIITDDFNDKIEPYKDIIPNQIYKEIEEFYNKGTTPKIILPPRIEKFDSKIIKPKLAKIILK
ncbi:unnamed protein product [Rhizophagus irregularis]|nr:unnamed protein product [Rhizophagus irregularis]